MTNNVFGDNTHSTSTSVPYWYWRNTQVLILHRHFRLQYFVLLYVYRGQGVS
jgi:hypothetical protein